MNHTPTPWEFDGNCGGYITQAGDKIARAYARSDAEFIAKAVNNYDALVKALTEIKKLKSTPIGDTGFSVGPLALLNAAQRIAKDALKAIK